MEIFNLMFNMVDNCAKCSVARFQKCANTEVSFRSIHFDCGNKISKPLNIYKSS